MTKPSPIDVESSAATDRSLLRRFRSGEQDAATTLYERYARKVQDVAKARTSPALAPRLDADDVVQSVFRTFFRRASEGQYEVPDGAELWNLLHVISLNKIRSLASHHRAAKRNVAATTPLEDNRAIASEGEDGLRLLKMVIDEALEAMPDDQRRMVQLRIEGHSVAEIALATQRSKRSVERLLQDFRGRLSRLIFEEPLKHDL
ncbi:MAG TPA: sigma-70 family RNA polymerase sigma factor [Lacipirellula sp.]